jgi:UDP-glucuronate 4-epimerase
LEKYYLVTGGAGFIGSHLCGKLVNQNKKVICLDNFDSYYTREEKQANVKDLLDSEFFTLVEGDILNSGFLKSIFEANEIQTVVHLAAQPGVRYSIENPEKYFEVNVLGTLRLLEIIKNHGIEKFVFASSSSVYGNNNTVPFTETDRIGSPASPYAASKIAAEAVCSSHAKLYNIPTVCLRFFTVYGPRQRPDMAIRKFVKSALSKNEIEIYGDGEARRDFTFIDDIISGIISSIHLKCDYEIFNLGDSRTVSLNELVAIIENALKSKIKIIRKNNQPGDVPLTYANIDKSKKMLGYIPEVPLEEGIAKYVKWFLNQSNHEA